LTLTSERRRRGPYDDAPGVAVFVVIADEHGFA
jgi:hypothetical protein